MAKVSRIDALIASLQKRKLTIGVEIVENRTPIVVALKQINTAGFKPTQVTFLQTLIDNYESDIANAGQAAQDEIDAVIAKLK